MVTFSRLVYVDLVSLNIIRFTCKAKERIPLVSSLNKYTTLYKKGFLLKPFKGMLKMIYTGEVLLIIENIHLVLDDDLIAKLNSQLQDYVKRNVLYDIDEDEGIDEIKIFF